MSKINDFVLNGAKDKIYALLDSSLVICAATDTGELLWTRFETSHINAKLVTGQENDIYYACQNSLKRRNPELISTKIPLVKVHTVEAKFGDNIILTSMEGKSLCSYDINAKKTLWEIRSSLVIQETLPVQILNEGKINNALIIRTQNHITIVDCTKGKIVYHTQMDNIAKIRKTGSHILAHKYNGATGIIKGVSYD
jgi:hypothetical protein